MIEAASEPSRPGSREQVATRIVFLVVGFLFATWAPLVPLAKARIGLDEGQLGVLLLFLGIGSIVGMPFSGGLAARFGCRTVILTAASTACSMLPIMATAGSSVLLAAALFVFGAAAGTVDVVMNIQAVIVEKASGRSMMSGFHGHFSLGGILGAGAVTGLLTLRASPIVAVMAMVLLSIVLILSFARGLLPYGSEEESPPFALPRGRVLLIGFLCLVLFLAEGAILDWSAVLLNEQRGVAKAQAGIGYMAFSVTMTLGRLLGDRIVGVFGGRRIVLYGSLCAAAGYLLASLAPWWLLTVTGFALVGVGASNVVPVLFTAAGRQESMPSNLAVAGVTTMGYAGILAGPALIGFLADWTTLPTAMLAVSVLLLLAGASARPATAE